MPCLNEFNQSCHLPEFFLSSSLSLVNSINVSGVRTHIEEDGKTLNIFIVVVVNDGTRRSSRLPRERRIGKNGK